MATRRIEITFERERNTLRSLLSFFNRGQGTKHAGGDRNGHSDGYSNGHGGAGGILTPVDLTKAEHFLDALTERHGELPPEAYDLEVDAIGALLFDGSALTSLAAGSPRARGYATWALRTKTRIVVAATAFLDPDVAAIAGNVADVLPIYASTAELASSILAASRVVLPFDALTVALASKLRPSAILTRDANGLRALANSIDQAGVSIFSL